MQYSLYTSDDNGASWDRISEPGELSLTELREVCRCLDSLYIVYDVFNHVVLTNCVECEVR